MSSKIDPRLIGLAGDTANESTDRLKEYREAKSRQILALLEKPNQEPEGEKREIGFKITTDGKGIAPEEVSRRITQIVEMCKGDPNFAVKAIELLDTVIDIMRSLKQGSSPTGDDKLEE